jgi:hypothetical protein
LVQFQQGPPYFTMINIIFRQLLGPSSARNTLLTTVLDLYNIPYRIIETPAEINGPVITDAFVEEIPSLDGELCKKIINCAVSIGAPILFYYPSECESTLSSSYYPTRDYVNGRTPIHVVKQGDRTVDGFIEHNLDKYFVYRLTTEFNRARLAYTARGIETTPKTHKFLFLNGTVRDNRVEMFEDLRSRDLLKHSIHSFIDYRIPEEYRERNVKPLIDWPNANLHEDFRFENFYPPHFWNTEFTLALETAPNELFVTEKTLKPLLVGHPFIAVSGRYFLKHLHKLGFKTFSNVINESYDDLEWPGERQRAVVEEVESLCKNNVELLHSTREARDHNRLNMYKLSEEVYLDLYNIIVSAFPEYSTADYINLPDLTLEKFIKYV